MNSIHKLPTYFRHAKKASQLSAHRRYRIGAALLTQSNKLISTGFNQYKTHPIIQGPQTLHAEIHAILRAYYIPRGAKLVVYRENINGSCGLAKPCKNCMNLIRKVGIEDIQWST